MQIKAALAVSLSSIILISGCVRDKEIEIQEPIEIDAKLIVDESSMTEIEFNTIVDDLALKTRNDSPNRLGHLSLEGNKILVESYDIDRPGVIFATLYSLSKGQQHSSAKNIEIAVRNNSARVIEKTAESAIKDRDKLLSLDEDYTAFKFIVDVAYLNKLIDYRDKKELLEDFNPTESSFYEESQNSLNELDRVYASYLAGNTSDSQLGHQIDSSMNTLTMHANYSNQALLSISTFYDPFLSDFSDGSFNYDEDHGRVSKYIGNDNLGEYHNGKWVFDAEYGLLNSLFKDM